MPHVQAFEMTANRIEGKVGTRRDEVEHGDDSRRTDVDLLIGNVVTALADQGLGLPADG